MRLGDDELSSFKIMAQFGKKAVILYNEEELVDAEHFVRFRVGLHDIAFCQEMGGLAEFVMQKFNE